MRRKKGFTLIELIMAIVIGAIILTPTSIIVVESVRNTFLPEYFTIASSLLEEKVEQVTNLRYGNLTNQAGSFTGNFSDYSYDVTVNYVDAGDLTMPVDPTETDYKRAQITISRLGFPDVSTTTLATNN